MHFAKKQQQRLSEVHEQHSLGNLIQLKEGFTIILPAFWLPADEGPATDAEESDEDEEASEKKHQKPRKKRKK